MVAFSRRHASEPPERVKEVIDIVRQIACHFPDDPEIISLLSKVESWIAAPGSDRHAAPSLLQLDRPESALTRRH
jgi:hypothetical protein